MIFSLFFQAIMEIHEEICTILKNIEDSVTCHLCHCAPKPGFYWFRCSKNHEICLNCVRIVGFRQCIFCAIGQISHEYCKIMMNLSMLNTNEFKVKKFKPKSSEPQVCANAIHGCQFKSEHVCDFNLVNWMLKRLFQAANYSKTCWPELLEAQKLNFQSLFDKGIFKLHYESVIESKFSYPDNLKSFSILLSKIEAFGQMFIERIRKEENGGFYHWIQHLGPLNEAKSFYYIIEYEGKFGKKYSFDGLFHGEVISVGVNFDKMVYKNMCFVTTYDALKKFYMNKLNTFWYSIKILKTTHDSQDVQTQ